MDNIVSFAEGLKIMNTKGALVKTCRFNKPSGIILLKYIDDYIELMLTTHSHWDTGHEDLFFSAFQWVREEIYKRWSDLKPVEALIPIKISLTKDMGAILADFLKYNHWNDTDLEDIVINNAAQWVTNNISKRWSWMELYGK